MSERKQKLDVNRSNRERALQIQQCFHLIAPPRGRKVISYEKEDLEPLAAAIREGRLDLLELAMSARHCSDLPENSDSLIIADQTASEQSKKDAEIRRHLFEKKFRESEEMLSNAAKWAVYLIVTGYTLPLGDLGSIIKKHDIMDFLENYFPQVYKAIPPISNKKAFAQFWEDIGIEIDQVRGSMQIEIKQILSAMKK